MNAIWIAIAAVSLLGLVLGLILGFASHRFHVAADPIVDRVEAILPQSQCGQCGYPGCRPYAEAVALHGEQINQCGPGGEAMILRLAEELNIDPQPLNGDTPGPQPALKVAWIDESNCIGCTTCIQACPVDAIIGITQAAHTVVSALCTGCNLCISPCPTECIKLCQVANKTVRPDWKWDLETIPVHLIQVEDHA
ncbi:MAG: electron transport complex subunit RsxB [Candidatus Malihini olakiniferum]